MKKYISMSLMLALITLFTLSFTACRSDDDDNNTPAPVVTLKEANIEETILCTQANIVAQGRTATILINVYDATGKTQKVAYPVTDSKYIGKLNIDGFHVHVDIANKNVVAGDLLKLTVTDDNGRSTTAQMTVTEEEDDDD